MRQGKKRKEGEQEHSHWKQHTKKVREVEEDDNDFCFSIGDLVSINDGSSPLLPPVLNPGADPSRCIDPFHTTVKDVSVQDLRFTFLFFRPILISKLLLASQHTDSSTEGGLLLWLLPLAVWRF